MVIILLYRHRTPLTREDSMPGFILRLLDSAEAHAIDNLILSRKFDCKFCSCRYRTLNFTLSMSCIHIYLGLGW